MKRTVTRQNLAHDLTVAFISGIDQGASDKSRLPWMWEMPPPANAWATLKEWIVVNMFLRTWGFRSHSRDLETAESLLDYFHAYTFEALIQKGMFERESETECFWRERYQQYYDAAHVSKELQFQLLRIAETFFRLCGHMNAIDICAVTVLFLHTLQAERQLIIDLERDVIIA
jgi:hypothetical protein